MKVEKGGIAFIIILFVLLAASTAVSYYRYMVRQNFTYYTDENDIPAQFDLSAYKTL